MNPSRRFASALFCCLLFCANDPLSSGSPVTATEEWKITASTTSNNAKVSLNKHLNGAVSCSGNWYYDFYGHAITCKIMSGSIVKDSTYLTFDCSGTASYSSDSSVNSESSPFTLTIKGQFKNGISSGSWQIDFFKDEWNKGNPEGLFTGDKVTGDGVTE
jgi:hypothetical protein